MSIVNYSSASISGAHTHKPPIWLPVVQYIFLPCMQSAFITIYKLREEAFRMGVLVMHAGTFTSERHLLVQFLEPRREKKNKTPNLLD